MTGAEGAAGGSAVPYADPQPMADIVAACDRVEAVCREHGLDLRAPAVPAPRAPVIRPRVSIDEPTRNLLDDYADYGS